MTSDDDQVKELLLRLTPSPAVSIDVESVRSGARRRLSWMVVVATAATVAFVFSATMVVASVLGGDTAPGPVAQATSTGDGPVAQATSTGDAAVTEDCPAWLPIEIATVGKTPADVVFVEDREFERLGSAGDAELGDEIARVTCTIADQSPDHDRPAYRFWHEGNAGYLPLGTSLRAVEGHDPRCRIGANVDGETRIYATALDQVGDCRPDAGTRCPESRLLPDGSFKLENWADFVTWAPHTYRPPSDGLAPRGDVPLGDQIGLITCNIAALADDLDRDREVTGPFLSGNATVLPVGTKLYAVTDYPPGCRIVAVVDGEAKEYLAVRDDRDEPLPCAVERGTESGVRVSVPSHCGVLSVTVEGQLWLASPPLGDDNPPPGWDENETAGVFTQIAPRRAEFRSDNGEAASFELAPAGSEDPNAGCE